MGVISYITSRKKNLTANSLIFWLLQFFCPLFSNVPQALGYRVILDVSTGLGSTVLHFNLLCFIYFFVVISICCKEKFPWYGMKATLAHITYFEIQIIYISGFTEKKMNLSYQKKDS